MHTGIFAGKKTKGRDNSRPFVFNGNLSGYAIQPLLYPSG